MAKIKLNRGTTFAMTYQHTHSGVPFSLVGATVRFTCKANEYDSDTADSTAVFPVKNITSGAIDGTAVIRIDPSDTATVAPGTYYYSIKVKEPDGSVYKTDEGTILLDGDPTNRLT